MTEGPGLTPGLPESGVPESDAREIDLRDRASSPVGVRLGVLGLQGDVSPHLRALAACEGADHVSTIRRPHDLGHVDGLLIPGGEVAAMDRLCRGSGLDVAIAERIAVGMPCLGTGAGMILLADEVDDPALQTIGGLDVTVRRHAFDRRVEPVELEVDFSALDDAASSSAPLTASLVRAPWVERAGPAVTVLASVHDPRVVGEAPRPVLVRQDKLLAAAFTPGQDGDLRVHQAFVRLVRQAAWLP